MKLDCQWLNANLENYFTERLSPDQVRLAAEHLEGCAACRQEIQSLQNVDGLVKQLFDYQLARAQSRRLSRRGFALPVAYAAAGVAVAFILAFALWSSQDTAPPQVVQLNPPPVEQTNSTPEPEVKLPGPPEVKRAKPKPEPQTSISTQQPPSAAPVPPGAPVFVVIDPAGYSTTLESYRGSVLLFGVWSADRPEAALNLERMYQAFGANPKIRILGVSNRRQERLAGTSFPLVFNNGSQLLGIGN